MKKIFIISYYFPPYRGVGAKRMASLSKFLSEKGYQVIVLKASDLNYGDEIDENLNTDDKNVLVEEIKAKNSLLHNIFVNCFKYKVSIKKLISQYNPSLVIFSGGPFFYFPIGNYIREKYSIPYILDF
ncbi:glycosyltransferase family 4 protein, partial [Candidatus Dojkabacteria bacterium]|nr:glycosyltransferase family 4 protein [Candidatus Dojkabacteria bacterium]